jgi:hypothetical protein
LAGIKRLLSNGLGSEWFTGTRHAADYLPVMRTNATFREVMCDRDRISEYPNGAIFIIDRHPACSLVKGEGMTRTGRKCSVSGHIFIKISDMQEFAGREQNLTRWSTYFGDNCWSFLPSDAKLPDAEPDVNDVCWIDDVSAFQGFDPLEHAQSTIQEMVDQLRRERKEMESLEMRAKDKPNNG